MMYFAIVYSDPWRVNFPDLDFFASGDTMEKACFEAADELLRRHKLALDFGEALATPSRMNQIIQMMEPDGIAVIGVGVPITYRDIENPVRVGWIIVKRSQTGAPGGKQ